MRCDDKKASDRSQVCIISSSGSQHYGISEQSDRLLRNRAIYTTKERLTRIREPRATFLFCFLKVSLGGKTPKLLKTDVDIYF